MKFEDKEFVSSFYGKCGIITVFDSNRKKHEKPKTNKPKDKTDKPKKDRKQTVKLLWKRRRYVKKLIVSVVSYIVKHLIKIKKLRFNGIIGLDNAANTAMVYGITSGVLYNSIGAVDKVIKVDGIDIKFRPDFKNQEIFIEFESIIKTNIYHVLVLATIVGVRTISILRKEKNNGKSHKRTD